ncbi:MAG: Cyanate transport protein CynX, partial [uncultured Thermomicrobiales bacterium]
AAIPELSRPVVRGGRGGGARRALSRLGPAAALAHRRRSDRRVRSRNAIGGSL